MDTIDPTIIAATNNVDMAKVLDDDQNIFLPKRIKMINATASTMHITSRSFRGGKVFRPVKTALIMVSKNIILKY